MPNVKHSVNGKKMKVKHVNFKGYKKDSSMLLVTKKRLTWINPMCKKISGKRHNIINFEMYKIL